MDTKQNKPLILIIDDEAEIGELLKSFFSDKFEVVNHSNAQNAIRAMKETEFDLILTDLNMPIISGMEIIKIARSTQKNPLIFGMSGSFESEEDLASAMDAGMKKVYSKPFEDIDVIIDEMQKYAKEKRSI